jgi:hypothetical protein
MVRLRREGREDETLKGGCGEPWQSAIGQDRRVIAELQDSPRVITQIVEGLQEIQSPVSLTDRSRAPHRTPQCLFTMSQEESGGSLPDSFRQTEPILLLIVYY